MNPTENDQPLETTNGLSPDEPLTSNKKGGLKKGMLLVAVFAILVGGSVWALFFRGDASTFEGTKQEATRLNSESNFAEEVEVWEKYLESPSLTDEEKSQALGSLSIARSNNNDLQGALEASIASLEATETPTAGHFQQIALKSEELGDKDRAIEYYLKVVPLLDPNSFTYNMDRQEIHNKLQELQKE